MTQSTKDAIRAIEKLLKDAIFNHQHDVALRHLDVLMRYVDDIPVREGV